MPGLAHRTYEGRLIRRRVIEAREDKLWQYDKYRRNSRGGQIEFCGLYGEVIVSTGNEQENQGPAKNEPGCARCPCRQREIDSHITEELGDPALGGPGGRKQYRQPKHSPDGR